VGINRTAGIFRPRICLHSVADVHHCVKIKKMAADGATYDEMRRATGACHMTIYRNTDRIHVLQHLTSDPQVLMTAIKQFRPQEPILQPGLGRPRRLWRICQGLVTGAQN
jgi:uncharacterized protein YerC